MDTYLFVTAFLAQHWGEVTTSVLALGGLGAALRKHAYAEFFMLVLDLTKSLAKAELADPAKRKQVADAAYAALPAWSRTFVRSQTEMESLVDRAFVLLEGQDAGQAG